MYVHVIVNPFLITPEHMPNSQFIIKCRLIFEELCYCVMLVFIFNMFIFLAKSNVCDLYLHEFWFSSPLNAVTNSMLLQWFIVFASSPCVPV